MHRFGYDIKIWDDKAQSYGRVYDLETKNRDIVSELVLNTSSDTYGEILLLEVGCGNGLVLERFINYPDKYRLITGIDISFEMLKVAKYRLKDNSYLIQGISQQLPYKDNKFNVVLGINLLVNLENIADAERTIVEMARVCSRGGKVLVEYRNKLNPSMRLACYKKKKRKIPHPYNAFSIFQLKKIIKKNNLNLCIEKVVPVFAENYKKFKLVLLNWLYILYKKLTQYKYFSPCVILVLRKK